jgi:LPXTG-site transpeptidase (sortase) family protein
MEGSSSQPKNLGISSNLMIYLGLILVFLGAASFILNSLQVWPFSNQENFEPNDNNYLSSNSSVPTIGVENIAVKLTPTIDKTMESIGLLPTALPLPQLAETIGRIPDRIVIPSINLDVPIEKAINGKLNVEGEKFDSWKAPDKNVAGWHESSALIGVPGNTVINGHNSYSLNGTDLLRGVFADLVNVKPGEKIFIFSGDKEFRYTIAVKMIYKERWQPVSVRLENSRWLGHSDDERITLVTCWPKESNTHRLFVIALPE